MTFDSILAVSDFSVQSAHVLERAALLARKHQVPLRLVHFVDSPKTFLADPIARLAQRARQLARRHEITALALDRSASLEEVLAEAGASGLLVMGPLSQRNWKRFFRGTTLDQAVHGSQCPLLVVRQAPINPYARVLVAVDLSPRSGPLIDFASRFSSPTMMKLFHAIDTIEDARLRSVRASSETLMVHRAGSRLQARERLERLIGDVAKCPDDQRCHSLAYDVGNGDAAYTTALHLQAMRAELVVVGKRRSSSLARFLAGSVAQRLARWADSDVLIAPLDRLSSSLAASVCRSPLAYGPASPWGAGVHDA